MEMELSVAVRLARAVRIVPLTAGRTVGSLLLLHL